ncbi:MAG TPA: hypothetical protein VMH24_06345 [Candidatus Sulfotelmatobacter sp.]|nr:hypothetical protein [Candidatus Sulfotelmatobacter sp.]
MIRAIGPMGWVVAERPLDTASPITVEDAVEALRSSVRSETGWVPRIVILDHDGRDVSTRYRVD